jgi:mRNA-degrading endonuclease RelE of RelBE toxin-antitoxin system
LSWHAEFTGTFQRSYKNLSSGIKKRVDEAILELLNADDPTKLGLRKWEGGKESILMKLGDSSDCCTVSDLKIDS